MINLFMFGENIMIINNLLIGEYGLIVLQKDGVKE
jgi:hypothetical protein